MKTDLLAAGWRPHINLPIARMEAERAKKKELADLAARERYEQSKKGEHHDYVSTGNGPGDETC